MTAWAQVLPATIGAVGGLVAGAAAAAKVRPENRRNSAESRRAESEAEQVDAAVHLELQRAAQEAIANVRRAAQESIRAARDEVAALRKKLEQVEVQAGTLQDRLRATEAELLQTRMENQELRAAQSAERRQLMEQFAAERAEHAAAMNLMRQQIQQLRIGRVSNGTGTLLNPEEFGS